MTTPYRLRIPSIGVSMNLTYLESKVNYNRYLYTPLWWNNGNCHSQVILIQISDISPSSFTYSLTIVNYVVEMSFLCTIYLIILPAIVTFWKVGWKYYILVSKIHFRQRFFMRIWNELQFRIFATSFSIYCSERLFFSIKYDFLNQQV